MYINEFQRAQSPHRRKQKKPKKTNVLFCIFKKRGLTAKITLTQMFIHTNEEKKDHLSFSEVNRIRHQVR